jgi:hypothetical protein
MEANVELKRRVARVVAVFAVAIGMGHVVQTLSERNKIEAELAKAAAEEPKAVVPVAAGPQATNVPTTIEVPPGVTPVVPATAIADAPAKAVLPATDTANAADPNAKLPTTAAPVATRQATLGALPAQNPPSMAKPLAETLTTVSPATTPSAPLPSDPPKVVATTEPPASIVPKTMEPLLQPQDDCAREMDLAVISDAIIEITLLAPCNPNERLVVRHDGMAITAKTTATGSAFLQIPALNATGDVRLRFADATEINGAIPVPDMATMRRFAVEWMANDTFELHAFENGAGYGMPGHISATNPGKLPLAAKPEGGYLMILGEAEVVQPMLAEVYTYPQDKTVPTEVSVEAEVSVTTCGREILGEVLSSQGGIATVSDLALAMPDCTALGDVLVLNNLVSDLTLAAMK